MRKNIFYYALEAFSDDTIALENVADGKSFIEKEYVLYARIENADVLKQAESFVDHEQWEVKIPKGNDNATGGRIRIRKTTDEKKVVSYIQTTKTKIQQGNEEIALQTTEDAFNQFKSMATSGMIKRRYLFPITGTDLKWEVDVFLLPSGESSVWVKIDLEVITDLPALPQLPEGFTDIISNQASVQTDEERKKIQELYNKVFLRKNEQAISNISAESYAKLIRN